MKTLHPSGRTVSTNFIRRWQTSKKPSTPGYSGLAVLLAVAWDSQLSPVAARKLSARSGRSDWFGTWFEVERAKTGRGALGTLSPRSDALPEAYLLQLPAEPVGTAPLFRNRSRQPYSKDTLGDDFRAVRAKVFGPQEKRQIADFRRSGATASLAREPRSSLAISRRWRCVRPARTLTGKARNS